MNKTLTAFGVVALSTVLGACAAPRSPDQLAQKTINYQCGPGGQDLLTVQYTFQGNEALSARVIYQNQVVMLHRATAANTDMVGNTFRSDNYTWITENFDYSTAESARGDMLTRNMIPAESTAVPPGVVDGSPSLPVEEVSDIVVSNCVPVTSTSRT